jgi:hypothetical protein
VRPDALGLHISKGDCWDIRVTEGSEKDVRPFSEILKMWRKASAEAKRGGKEDSLSIEDVEFFRAYSERVGASYRKSWPRPWPCGTIWLKWDARWVEPKTYSLNPANGVFILDLKIKTFHEQERPRRRDIQDGGITSKASVLSTTRFPEAVWADEPMVHWPIR